MTSFCQPYPSPVFTLQYIPPVSSYETVSYFAALIWPICLPAPPVNIHGQVSSLLLPQEAAVPLLCRHGLLVDCHLPRLTVRNVPGSHTVHRCHSLITCQLRNFVSGLEVEFRQHDIWYHAHIAFRDLWRGRVHFLDVRAGLYRDVLPTSTAFELEVFVVAAGLAFVLFGYVGAMRQATVGFANLVVGLLAAVVAVVDVFAAAADLKRVLWGADCVAVGAGRGRHVGSRL